MFPCGVEGFVRVDILLLAQEAKAHESGHTSPFGRRLFPVRVLWYQDPAARLIPVNACRCKTCGSPLASDGYGAPVKLGLGKNTLMHVIIVRAQCKACGRRRLTAVSDAVEPPAGARLVPPVDFVRRTILDMPLTDFLCRAYRKHWNQQALQASYVDLIGSSLPYIEVSYTANLKQTVFLYLACGIPGAQQLATIVLLAFQQHELPRVEEEVRWICARFGAVIASDGSSAPLQEARAFCRKGDRAGRARAPCAALRVLGLFDIPLCPYVFVRSEGRPSMAELVGFVVSQAKMVDPEALPLGWVQDNTESMWGSMVHVAQKLMHAQAHIQVDHESKMLSGFHVGLDPKHVEWRLQDALDARSADFLQAAWALRTLFSRLFNVVQEADKGLSGHDGDVSEQASWGPTWEQWLLNARVEKSPSAGRAFLALYKQALQGNIEAQASFRSDGCCPPRCVVENFLSCIGISRQSDLWETDLRANVYKEELEAFTAWFEVAMVP